MLTKHINVSIMNLHKINVHIKCYKLDIIMFLVCMMYYCNHGKSLTSQIVGRKGYYFIS